jgi:hypothetical protein
MSSANLVLYFISCALVGGVAFGVPMVYAIRGMHHTPRHLASRYRGKRLKGVARGESWRDYRDYIEKYIQNTEESQ